MKKLFAPINVFLLFAVVIIISCSDDQPESLLFQVGEWEVVSIVTTFEQTPTDTIEIARDTSVFTLVLNKDGAGLIRDSIIENKILDWNIDDNRDDIINITVELTNISSGTKREVSYVYFILVNEVNHQVWNIEREFINPGSNRTREKEIWEMNRVK
ncbi:MAG TPA: hypothetical protein ENJ28_10960 [Gammaproteobacteria bacterium]|nr:hypothetical protein [Gammaproteobacteria bacterium]